MDDLSSQSSVLDEQERIILDLSRLHQEISLLIGKLSKFMSIDDSQRSQLASQTLELIRQADSSAEIAVELGENIESSKDSKEVPLSPAGNDLKRRESELSQRLKEILEDLKLDRIAFRKAQLASKNASMKLRKNEREQLFSGRRSAGSMSSTSPSLSDEVMPNKALKTAEDATASLKRTHQLLEAEIAKSALSVEVLDESNTLLRKLAKQYTTFDVVLTTSRRVITVLEQADKWDRIYMIASLSFLLVVVLYVLWRRVLRGPFRLILWAAIKSGNVMSWAWNQDTGSGKASIYSSSSQSASMHDTISQLIVASSLDEAPYSQVFSTSGSEEAMIATVSVTMAAISSVAYDEL
ncbi:Sec20-domain-containing protein [Dipodascopsis uninucleata]